MPRAVVMDDKHYRMEGSFSKRINPFDYQQAYLEQGEKISAVIGNRLPFLDKWGHNDVDELFLIDCCANNVGQSAHSVVKEQQVAMLIFVECCGKSHKDGMKVWNKVSGNAFLEE